MEIKGMTYGYMAGRGDYRSIPASISQDRMYELGINWVCIPVVNYQKDINSTKIYRKYSDPSDRDLMFLIQRTHEKGMRVCLKPMVNSEDYMWRAFIGKSWSRGNEADPEWDRWFKSYTEFILYYAELAEETNCGMLCIGCEMLETEHREHDWNTLIQRVRSIYSGKVVYNTNHHAEEGAKWFDKLDYIATSAYYSVGSEGTDKESMKEEWAKVKTRLDQLAKKKDKKYLFMEIGCRSGQGCSKMPWDFDQKVPPSEEEQATFYESCLETFAGCPHFAGAFWWDWSTVLPYSRLLETRLDISYNVAYKEAEDVLKKYHNLSL
jgi:hypothetical protein